MVEWLVEVFGDGFVDVGFVYFWWVDQEYDGVGDFVFEIIYGEEFEDVIFDVVEVCVMFVEDFVCMFEVEFVFVVYVLGQGCGLVQVVVGDGVFG